MIAKRTLLLWLVSFPAFATDLGVFGQTYPIIELPADKLIAQRIQSFSPQQKAEIEKQFLAKTKASVIHPQGYSLPRAAKNSKRLLDPSVHFPEDILDANGKVIISKNAKVNPLDHVSLDKPLVFFDGEDEEQKDWVKKHNLEATLILTNGEPLTLQEEWRQKIFFDQGGKFRAHFSLKALPTIVTQEGKRLRIEECVPS